MIKMLGGWLVCSERNPGYGSFTTVDVSCTQDRPDEEAKEHLKELLVNARIDPQFLRDASEELEWDRVAQLIAEAFPRRLKTKRGFFGEVLAVAMLQEFHEYEVPIQKLRYAIQGDQTLPGTDAIVLKTDAEGEISELCFVESKFRSQADTAAAVNAYEQLRVDIHKRVPDLLRFIAERLSETNHPLAPAIRRYMADRSGRDERDGFRISLTWERGAWSDRTLDNLSDNDVDLAPLSVHVVKIDQLVALTDELFSAIGIENIDEDDD